MRTTIDLDDELLRKIKSVAARSGRSMNDVVGDALRDLLFRREERSRPERPMPRFKGGPPRPGVDVNSWASLLDLEDADDQSGR
jgi:hypothetical protein